MVNESADGMRLSRISKLFVDRDGMMVPEALLRRQNHSVTLICGADVGESYTLPRISDLAPLTARVYTLTRRSATISPPERGGG